MAGQDGKGNIKLSRQKTQVILEPTIKQSENEINIKNSPLQTPDNPRNPGKPVRQVKEAELSEKDVLAGLVAKGVSHLLKKAFGKSKPVKATKQGPWGTRPTGPQVKPPKPPTQAQQKKDDLDKSNADFAAWKTKKADMTRVFKAAHDQGLDKDINTPYKSRLDRQQANAAMKARAANPLKQANEPPAETPAAPEQKPRVRVKAVIRPSEPQTNKITRRQFSSLLKNNPNMKVKSGLGEDGVPTNTVGSGNIAGFSPILGPILRRKRKTGNS